MPLRHFHKLTIAGLIFTALFLNTSHAQSETNPDCAYEKISPAEVNHSALMDFEKADYVLNQIYARKLKGLKKSQQTRLRISQRTWLQGRDHNCYVDHKQEEGETIWPMLFATCQKEATLRQIEVLAQSQ